MLSTYRLDCRGGPHSYPGLIKLRVAASPRALTFPSATPRRTELALISPLPLLYFPLSAADHEYVHTLYRDMQQGVVPTELASSSPSRQQGMHSPSRRHSGSSQQEAKAGSLGWTNMFGLRAGKKEPAGRASSSTLAANDAVPVLTEDTLPPPRLEESFTVHLGTQKKSTHNLRLIATDILATAGQEQDESQRLATAISLCVTCPGPFLR